MTQVSIEVKNEQYLRDVVSDLALAPGQIKRLIRTASWDTAKNTKTDFSSRVRKKVAIKKKDLDPHLSATRVGEGAKVSVKESKRLPLRDFGARELKKSGGGVTYKISKDGGTVTGVEMGKGKAVATSKGRGGRGRIADAFIVQKYGGHVFRRVDKKRLPIRKLYAVSAWGVVVKNDMIEPVAHTAEVNLEKNVRRRLNLEVLRKTGKVKT